MSYRSETIATTISRLNVQYFLPAIQREFVWKPQQIMQLFDSIMRGYPISSFLFWELKPENRDKWEAYKFIDNANHGGTHNSLGNTNGIPQLTLVLDGQQRLTSLLIGLRGTYTDKLKYKRWDNPDAFVKQRLYLDLLKDARELEENGEGGETGIYFGFEFFNKAPKSDTKHHWFQVGKILDFDSEDAFFEFRQAQEDKLPEDLTRKQVAVFQRNLERLYRAIWKDQVIAYYTEYEQDYDRVLDIFVRANEGGTKLSKSDLLLSMVTSKWAGMNARDEIYAFVDRLNTDLTRKNDFDKDFIMKSCLVLTDLPVAYKVQNFSVANLSKIRESWNGIKSAIERTVDLANTFGINRDNLTSANALIPVIYYLMKRPRLTLKGTTAFEVSNASRIRKWLVMCLINGVFGGASDNMLRDIRGVLQKHSGIDHEFPVNEANLVIKRAGRNAIFDDVAINDILELTYSKQQTFLALSLLYDDCAWGTAKYHQDHIFPKAMFKVKDLKGTDREKWLSYKDCLGNLCLLWSRENEEKSAKPFELWIKSRDASFRKRHLIPEDSRLWKFDRFDEFLKAREELISQRLKLIL